jgi:hypothetical protein
MDWARMLAYLTGTVDQELLARNEYLAAENPQAQKTQTTEKPIILGGVGSRITVAGLTSTFMGKT